MRPVPPTLFGRLVLVLLGGLLLAQVLTGYVHLSDRVEAVYRTSRVQAAYRIGAAIDVLDRAAPADRAALVAALDSPLLRVSLGGRPPTARGARERASGEGAVLGGLVRAAIGDDRPLVVEVADDEPERPGPGGGRRLGPGFGRHHPMMEMHAARHGAARAHQAFSIHTLLAGGEPVSFRYLPLVESGYSASTLVAAVGVLLLSVVALSLLAVRWLTRPLRTLAEAAEGLGQDLHRAPIPETGPLEVLSAARAFNRMQSRIAGFVDERTRMLAALSHDLKTPVTRLRLRAESFEPPDLRERCVADLDEMADMVSRTLELIRGVDAAEPREPVDLQAMLETLQADASDLGRSVSLEGTVRTPLVCQPVAVKRCFDNVLGNALRYGERAWITIRDERDRVRVEFEDDGPGIPPDERERVFEPFHRLEGSRGRDTGGVGLGLAIARGVARAHGGEIRIGDGARGGARVSVELPRA